MTRKKQTQGDNHMKTALITRKMSQAEVFDKVCKIDDLMKMNDALVEKTEKILNILEGDGTFDHRGVVDIVRETNGKVKWHTKMIYSLWGIMGTITLILITMFIQHLGTTKVI